MSATGCSGGEEEFGRMSTTIFPDSGTDDDSYVE
jgi:hypothetical protein